MATVWATPPFYSGTIDGQHTYIVPQRDMAATPSSLRGHGIGRMRWQIKLTSSDFVGSITVKRRMGETPLVAVPYTVITTNDTSTDAITDSAWIYVEGTATDVALDVTDYTSGTMAFAASPASIPVWARRREEATAAPVVLFSDTFTRSGDLDASDSDSGHTWTVHSGSFETTGTRVRQTGIGEAFATVDFGVSDFEYQYEMSLITIEGNSSAWTPFRYVDANNFHMVQSNDTTGHTWFKRVAGTFTQLIAGGAAADGDVIKVRVDGSSLELFVNGVSVGTASDAAHLTATRGGVGSLAFGANQNEWDDCQVTPV